ncbi:SNF2 family N-terminal domain containing protein [Aphelenchoides avenae]|nr:SNF2 family N-terminal domain containing protein [Aphelenchus avenae]
MSTTSARMTSSRPVTTKLSQLAKPGPKGPAYQKVKKRRAVAAVSAVGLDFEVPTEPSISQPATFRRSVKLYPHQLTGMEWMEVREQCGNCRGGILADAPGCGKTVTVGGHLSRQKLKSVNVVRRLRFDNEASDSEIEVVEDRLSFRVGKRKAQCALVVTPKAVIEQWKEQLTKTFMRRNALRVCMFYEDKRDKISDDMLATYDLVLTTFKTLQVDVLGYRRNGELIQPKGRLSQFHWSRVILDEAHQTKTEKVHPRSHVAQNLEQQRLTKLKACCAVEADIRWCVTGTPMDGRVEHLDALFKFLKAPSTLPKEELMLMRTKKGRGKCFVNVEKIWHHEDIELETVERRFYNQMTDFIETWQCETARNRIWMSENRASIGAEVARLHRKPDSECTRQSNEPKHVAYWEKYDELCKNHPMWDAQSPQWEYLIQAFPMYRTLNGFTTDLRLRQISVHMAIAEKAVGTGDAVDDAAQALDEEVRKSLLANGVSREELKRIFQADHVSSKMKRLLQLLVPTVKGGEKCVVVSQWESLLQIVGRHLDKTGISHEIMSGKISAKERYASAQRFNNRDSKPQVLLLASQSCGTGVDLPGGTHMFLMEPQKSAALEKQVFNRLHRIGQTKNVHYYRLVAVDTVEQRVMRQRMDREYETKKYFTN